MLTELKFEDGKTRIDLVDGTTMSVITPERRRAVDAGVEKELNRLATRDLELSNDPHPIPDGLVEVAFVHPELPMHLPWVKPEEWADNQKDEAFSGTWTLYHVTSQQVLDYANKVGVK